MLFHSRFAPVFRLSPLVRMMSSRRAVFEVAAAFSERPARLIPAPGLLSASLLLPALLVLPLLAACSPDFFASLLPAYGEVRVAGADGGNALLVPRTSDDAFDSIGSAHPAAREIIKLDLASSDVFHPVTVTGTAPAAVVADGRWIAWFDFDAVAVKVYDASTAETRSYFEQGDELADAVVDEIDGDRLLLRGFRPGTENQTNPEALFVILDLTTGARKVLAGSMLDFGTALSGDWLAYFDDEAVTIAPLSLEFVANVNLVNVITSERRTIAPNIRVNGGGDAGVYIADGLVIWQEYKNDGFASRIRAYDIDGDKLSTAIEDFDSEAGARSLADAADGVILVKQIEGEYLSPAKVTIYTRIIGKEKSTTLASYDTPINAAGRHFETEPRLINGFAGWTDPASGRFTSFELATGQTRVYTLPID